MTTVQNFPSADEIKTAKVAFEKLERIIDSEAKTHKLIVDGDELQLPFVVLKTLLCVLAENCKGNAVSIAPIRPNLTVHEAAGLLNVTPQTVIDLIGSKLLPYAVTDNRKVVACSDLIEFMKRSQRRRLKVLDKLSRLDQESNTGY